MLTCAVLKLECAVPWIDGQTAEVTMCVYCSARLCLMYQGPHIHCFDLLVTAEEKGHPIYEKQQKLLV